MKKKCVITFMLIFLALLIVLFVIRVWKINDKYGLKTSKAYDINEIMECDGVEYTVLGTRVCTVDDTEQTKLLCVRVSVKNVSGRIKDMMLSDYTMNLNYNLIYPGMDYIAYVNDNISSMSVKIYPGVKAEFELPYVIEDKYLNTASKKYTLEDYCELDFELYPDKKMVMLDTDILYEDEK